MNRKFERQFGKIAVLAAIVLNERIEGFRERCQAAQLAIECRKAHLAAKHVIIVAI